MSLKIRKLDRPTAIQIRGEMESWLEDMTRLLGVKLTAGPGTINSHGLEFTIRLTIFHDDGYPMTAERKAFPAFAKRNGLKPEDWGKVVVIEDEAWRIVGANKRKKKYPILCEHTKTKKEKGFAIPVIKKALKELAAFLWEQECEARRRAQQSKPATNPALV